MKKGDPRFELLAEHPAITELDRRISDLEEDIKTKDDKDTAKDWFNKAAQKININAENIESFYKRLERLEGIYDDEHDKQILAEFPTRKRTYALAFIGFSLVIYYFSNPIILTLGLMIFIFFLVHDYFIDDLKSLVYAFVQAWKSKK